MEVVIVTTVTGMEKILAKVVMDKDIQDVIIAEGLVPAENVAVLDKFVVKIVAEVVTFLTMDRRGNVISAKELGIENVLTVLECSQVLVVTVKSVKEQES